MNLIDIAKMTDAVLNTFLTIKADPEGAHDVDHLSRIERSQLLAALGTPTDSTPANHWLDA